MKRERMDFLCSESEEGRDAFVTHLTSGEDGRVESCRLDHLIVKTTSGKDACWDYHDCDEIARTGAEFPWR